MRSGSRILKQLLGSARPVVTSRVARSALVGSTLIAGGCGALSLALSDGKAKEKFSIQLEKDSYLALLERLISYTDRLQNNPPALIPREDLVADEIIKYLKPYIGPNGPLEVRKVTYVDGRSNLIIIYKAAKSTKKYVSFVGSHMDVVAADPALWSRNPFKLTVEGDKLYGRGVTDCLGHVALLANVFKQLAEKKPDLNINVAAVLIANEEFSSPGVGVDEMEKRGEIEFCKGGPLYWVDSANFGPTLGTGGMLTWKLNVKGKLFHSGLPHKAINPINLGNEAIRYIQTRFHDDFPMGAKEKEYLFQVGSSLKPTQINTPAGSINQIPPSHHDHDHDHHDHDQHHGQRDEEEEREKRASGASKKGRHACGCEDNIPPLVTIAGDIRVTPFHDLNKVKSKVESYIKEFESNLDKHPRLGYDQYSLPEENLKGTLELEWTNEPMKSIAVDLKSPGYAALIGAIKQVRGEAKPFSITGSLPLVGDLKDAGFDVQITGFGRMDAYHANNEYGMLSEFEQGTKIVGLIIDDLNRNL